MSVILTNDTRYPVPHNHSFDTLNLERAETNRLRTGHPSLLTRTNHPDPRPVLGLDHITVAVGDLEAAAERYRQLGFTLKPGRPHENGIRNHHVKFSDGTEIELITAAEARDAATTAYLKHLSQGDGPAFAAFYAPDMDAVAERLDKLGRKYRHAGRFLTLHEDDELDYIFFGPRNHSPTDRPEHFRHANGAESLIALWFASDDYSAEEDLLAAVGATLTDEKVRSPQVSSGRIARFAQSEVVLLPGAHQLVAGRRIVGATLRTRNLEDLKILLGDEHGDEITFVETKRGRSIFLPPGITHGIWLEFRATR